jgi:multiple sugar transport system substrate-binding protein
MKSSRENSKSMTRALSSAGRCSIIVLLFCQTMSVVAAAQTRFDGVEIRVGVMKASAIGGPARKHGKSWESATGGKVKILDYPFADLFNQFNGALTSASDIFDVILYAPAWTADFAPYLSTIPEKLSQNEAFDDIHPVYRERLMKWENDWLAITIDGDLFSGYYRKDLFQNTENQADFRIRYGYELSPPDTWTEYRDIAEFFTGRKDNQGNLLYGTVEAFVRGGQQFWNLFARASAYANHPNRKGAQFFDPDTMQAQINNPAWVRAVSEYREIVNFSPPGALEFGIAEARIPFINGQTAMILDWGDTGQLSANPTISKVAGNVGFFVLPGSKQVWDYVNQQWDNMDRPHKAPFLAFGGWVGSVPKTSKQKSAALDYLMWYSSPENSLKDVVSSGTGINPYRYTHFSNIDAWSKAFTPRAAAAYLGVLKTSLDSPNVALDLRLPGFHDYTESLEVELERVLRDGKSAQLAMNGVAVQWEAITEKRGRGKQTDLYRASMGLEAINYERKNKYVIGFSQATTTEPWRLLFNKTLREEAAKYSNIELIVSDGMDDAKKQASDVESFIQQKVDAILITPKVAEDLTPVVNKAHSEGIPVIVLDRDLANDKYAQFIGGDNNLIGRAAGDYAVNLLGGKGKASGTIVEIWGGMASTPAQDRNKGFHSAIDSEPGITMAIKPADGDWKQDKAYEIMAAVLLENKKIDLVYAHNDPMAFGAYQAAKDEGREKEMFFLGIDAIPGEGIKWVEQGILTATFVYDTPGDEGIQQALRILASAPFTKRIILPTMTVDRNNAAGILAAHGIK